MTAPAHALHALAARQVPPPVAGSVALAARQYRAVSLEARVASASPHELVLLLFERLSLLLNEALGAAAQPARRFHALERAMAIVDGLDTTLDDARGGDVARALHTAYAMLKARLADGGEAALREAISATDDLSSAWRSIGVGGEGRSNVAGLASAA